MARGKAPKSTICGTKESTKKHDIEHGFWQEGEHQKAQFFARGTTKTRILRTKESTKKTRSRARCLDKGEQCTKESTKKHDIEHGFWHEGEHQKARFCARGRAPKSTILCTRQSTKKHDLEHDFLHEGKHRKARFAHEGKHSKQRSPKYKDIFFLTVTAIRTDSSHTQNCTNTYLQGTRKYVPVLLCTTKLAQRKLLHTASSFAEKLHTACFLNRGAFTHRSFYTTSFYTKKLLRTASFYTQQAFTHRTLYHRVLLHMASVYTHRSFYKEKLLHTASSYRKVWTRRSFLAHNDNRNCISKTGFRRQSEKKTILAHFSTGV